MLNLTSWILSVQASLLALMAGSSGVFIGVAQSFVTALAVVLVLFFGLRSAQALEHGQAAPVGGLIVIGLKMGLCLAVLRFWNIPAPGLGAPLGTWIPNEGLKLALLVSWNGAQQVAQSITSWSGMEVPSSMFSIGTLWWLFAQIFLLGAAIVLAIVLIGPMLILAGLIIIGPLFVPMWPIPELTGYARGYLRSLITYSLVPVLAAIELRIIAQILFPTLGQVQPIATSVEGFLFKGLLLVVSLAVGLYGMFECVKRANQIMSGSGGSGGGWLLGAAAAVKALF